MGPETIFVIGTWIPPLGLHPTPLLRCPLPPTHSINEIQMHAAATGTSHGPCACVVQQQTPVNWEHTPPPDIEAAINHTPIDPQSTCQRSISDLPQPSLYPRALYKASLTSTAGLRMQVYTGPSLRRLSAGGSPGVPPQCAMRRSMGWTQIIAGSRDLPGRMIMGCGARSRLFWTLCIYPRHSRNMQILPSPPCIVHPFDASSIASMDYDCLRHNQPVWFPCA